MAQEDQAWFDALSGKTDTGQAARLRQVLRDAELADAAQEDTSHDWQRLQFALRREKAKPEAKHPRFKYVASVIIVVCAASVILETLKEPGFSPSEPAPVVAAMPPPVADASPAIASPSAAATESTTEHAKVKSAAKQDESENQETSQLMNQQRDIEIQRDKEMKSRRSMPMEESDSPRVQMAPPPTEASPPVTVVQDSSDQMVTTSTPEQEYNQLEFELAQLGVNVVKSNSGEQYMLHITLTNPVKTEVSAVLKAHGIQVPEQGELTVTFMKPAPRQ